MDLAELLDAPDAWGDDLEALASTLAELRRTIGALRQCESSLVAHMASLMPKARVEVTPTLVLERKPGSVRKGWDHEGLFRVVLARARDERRVDEETGEYEDVGEVAVRVLSECAHVDYWRLDPLRKRTDDVHEFAVPWLVVGPSQ